MKTFMLFLFDGTVSYAKGVNKGEALARWEAETGESRESVERTRRI